MEDYVILHQLINCWLHFVVSLWLNHAMYNAAQENQGMHFVASVSPFEFPLQNGRPCAPFQGLARLKNKMKKWVENKYYSQDHDETVTSLPNRQCPEQGRFFFLIGNICSPGLCPWSYIYIYIVQDSVLGVVYIYIYIHRVFGVIQICVA